MPQKTLAEMFSNVVTGRYMGTSGRNILWQLLGSHWVAADVCADLTTDDVLTDDVMAAVEAKDPAAMLVLCDRAQELGVSSELCELTRAAIRRQYEGVPQ